MKSYNLFFLLILALTLTACSKANQTSTEQNNPSDQTVTNFEQCVKAGNLAMESYPRRCQHEDEVFVEEIESEEPTESTGPDGNDVPCAPDANKPGCLPEAALPDVQKPCTREFMPVCGEIQVQCVNTPCDPIQMTFANRCEAENAGATDITEGACLDEEVNPEGACLSFDGNWLPETKECEGMAQEQCEVLGGTYNECASACRNDPDAEVCTLECVQVCQFE